MRPSVREQAETREKDEALRETASGAEPREASGVERLGGALARVGLALSACMLGVVLLVVCFSTVWLMVGADDGNLTQSMSLRTWLGASTRVDL